MTANHQTRWSSRATLALLVVLFLSSGFVAAEQIPAKAKRPVHGNVITVNIDDLAIPAECYKNFKRSLIPKSIARLHGKRVRIYGDMDIASVFKKTGNKGFLLIGDTRKKRQYYSSAPVQHFIPVFLRDGTTTKLTHRPLVIEGIFLIDPWIEDGQLLQLYRIKDATVDETKRRKGFQRSVHWGC
ncbi:MAG: hypothetical protein IID45_12450 [Planctomycetes bacterium]|nr:hypothetical protein [Planctomycetota bacterium]